MEPRGSSLRQIALREPDADPLVVVEQVDHPVAVSAVPVGGERVGEVEFVQSDAGRGGVEQCQRLVEIGREHLRDLVQRPVARAEHG